MGNVVQFGKRAPQVWVCLCGCSTFRLHSSGITECASCGNMGCDNAEWFSELPEPAMSPKECLPETKVISMNGTPEMALRKMLSRVDPETTTAVIAIAENGRVNTWGGIEKQDEAEWLDRRLDDARGLLCSFIPKDGG